MKTPVRLEMEQDEEEDYMSEHFINPSSDASSERPGLTFDRSTKRKLEVLRKKELADKRYRQENVPKDKLAKDELMKGLQKPLGSENKGFMMLQKMGFTPGTGIGAKSEGIVEPVTINIKNNRAGFGREQAIRDIELRKKQFRDRRKNTMNIGVDDFRSAMSRKSKEREFTRDLKKSANACYTLDQANGIDFPNEHWFWPEECIPLDEEDEDEDAEDEVVYDIQTQLETLTLYLRGTYNYCVWCGNQFSDNNDLAASCPGPSSEDH